MREEEIKQKTYFYTLQISDEDKEDIATLKTIESKLHEVRPLRMLIWSTYYLDKFNSLAARVGAKDNPCGIYKITHIDTGRAYIGQSTKIKDRWTKEIKEGLGIDAPKTNERWKFMYQHGVDNFTFEILEKCKSEELDEKEKKWIEMYQAYDFGLNSTR